MTHVHRYLGMVLLVLFVVIIVWALFLRVLRREETPPALHAVQHWTENLLLVQLVAGIVLLVLGRRVTGAPFAWMHYLYGSLFPLVALLAGRLIGLRRERYEYVGLAWGSLFALALALRAVQTGCGAVLGGLASCFGLG